MFNDMYANLKSLDSGLPTLIHEDSWTFFTYSWLMQRYPSILTSFGTQFYRVDVSDLWNMFVKMKR